MSMNIGKLVTINQALWDKDLRVDSSSALSAPASTNRIDTSESSASRPASTQPDVPPLSKHEYECFIYVDRDHRTRK